MTNTIKRLAGAFIAFIVCLAAVVTGVSTAHVAYADTSATTTITVKDKEEGSTYAAYQLMTLTEGEAADGSKTFSYSVNPKYAAALKDVTKKNADAEILDYLNGLDAAQVAEFAQEMSAKVSSMTADATLNGNASATVPQGYYLIAQTNPTADADKSKSSMILQTAGKDKVEVEAKKDVPSVVKKVQENKDGVNDEQAGKYQDSADYNIGDKVPFQLTGTLPTNLASYRTYRYVFHDSQSAGLTFDKGSVKVFVEHNGAETAVDVSRYTVASPSGTDTFAVSFADVKPFAKAGDKIIVRYESTLNENAVIGAAGNPNKVHLEFSNNPNKGGEGETGKTPEDKVIVFTFKAVANKTDEKGNALKGAGFTLYKADGTKIKEIAAGDATTFEFKGLDSGKYKLVETTVPDGYTKASDIEFTIKATYETLSDDPKLVKLDVDPADAFNVDSQAGSVTTTVVNKSGHELPKTGGAGVIALYVVGLALIAAAIVAIVIRRRNEGKR